jgi:hypothetical protein
MSSNKIEDQRRLEEQYPGKLAEISSADYQTVKNETMLFKRAFEKVQQEFDSIIHAGAEAVLWDAEEKSIANEAKVRLDALSGWGEAIRERCEVLGDPSLHSHDYSSMTDEQNALLSILSILASVRKDISSAALELAHTLVSYRDGGNQQ